jgi:hypothetical protein
LIFSPSAVIPQSAGFAAGQRPAVEEYAYQQFEVIPNRVKPQLPRGRYQRMMVQNYNFPVCLPRQFSQPPAQFQFLRRE